MKLCLKPRLPAFMSADDKSLPRERVRLPELPLGERGRVCALEGDANLCTRLREIGICESATIERLSGSHTLLCQLSGTRIALNGRAAQGIWVERPAN